MINQTCSDSSLGLTVSDQDQGALGFGLAVVDLDGVSALAVSGEMIHRHLDDSCGHIVADLVSLSGRFAGTTHQEIKCDQCVMNYFTYSDAMLYPQFPAILLFPILFEV